MAGNVRMHALQGVELQAAPRQAFGQARVAALPGSRLPLGLFGNRLPRPRDQRRSCTASMYGGSPQSRGTVSTTKSLTQSEGSTAAMPWPSDGAVEKASTARPKPGRCPLHND